MPAPGPSTEPNPPASLVQALRRLLRPVVRLLMSHQITFPFLAGLLKEIFVDVAEHDFQLHDKAQTDSRVSLLTGIHRKDVRRLRGNTVQNHETPRNISLGSQIIAHWSTQSRFLDAGGQPLPLPRQVGEASPNFEDLVESVSRDIRPRAILDEWLRLGVVDLDSRDRVVLDVSAFIPSKGFDEKAFYFGRNLHDHIAAGSHNLLGEEPPFVDRSVYYDGLAQDSVAELNRHAEELGMEALKSINRRAQGLQERDRDRGESKRRFNFGIYIYDAFEDSIEPEREDGDD